MNLGLRFDYVRGLELGAGHVVLDDVTREIPATSLAGVADCLVYLSIDLDGPGVEVVHDPDVTSWDREDWGRREPLFLGVVRGGELGLVDAALVAPMPGQEFPPDGPASRPGRPPALLRDVLAGARKASRPALASARQPGLRGADGGPVPPLVRSRA